MKHANVAVGMIFLLAGFTTGALAGDASIEQGKTLFNDPTLGNARSGKSCASCHPDGKGMEKAGKRANLTGMINGCIVSALQGKKLDADSVEMGSLKLYIESLGK